MPKIQGMAVWMGFISIEIKDQGSHENANTVARSVTNVTSLKSNVLYGVS
jgi:hypothetical protein